MESENNEFTTIYECGRNLCQYRYEQYFTASEKNQNTEGSCIQILLLETGH